MRDKKYWEGFYNNFRSPYPPSPFSVYCLNKYLKRGMCLVELGCGNGRDAVFFAEHGLKVIAIDQCRNELDFLREQQNFSNLRWICSDFSRLDKELGTGQVVYSRFTLHAIDAESERRTLDWSTAFLQPGGYFCIEARGIQNEIYGKGRPVNGERNAFIYEGHYRRFLVFEELCASLKKRGFLFEEASEENGIAPWNGQDEIFIRVIARKCFPESNVVSGE